jgi:hypothetical protein
MVFSTFAWTMFVRERNIIPRTMVMVWYMMIKNEMNHLPMLEVESLLECAGRFCFNVQMWLKISNFELEKVYSRFIFALCHFGVCRDS